MFRMLSAYLATIVVGATLAMAQVNRAGAEDAPDQMVRFGSLEVALWLPLGQSEPHPLVLFSHGFGGCKTQSSYLMRALAQHGIVVAAADHADNRCLTGPPQELPPDFHPVNWSDNFYAARRTDIRNLREAVQTDSKLSPIIDRRRVALVGHSLGGYTVLGLAGGWPSWKMDEIAAVVALAPFAQPFSRGGTLAGIAAPVLFELGTDDGLITTQVQELGIFEAIRGPACRILYQGASHLAWTDLRPEFHAVTAAATIAFLDEVFAGRRPTEIALALPSQHRAVCK